MLEAEKEYECQNPRCRCRFKVKADIEQGGIMEVPVSSIRMCVALDALSIEPKRGQVQICAIQTDRSACFQSTFIQGSVVCCDYEEILMQERIQMLEVGTMPRSITIILLNDLVDCCKVRSLRY